MFVVRLLEGATSTPEKGKVFDYTGSPACGANRLPCGASPGVKRYRPGIRLRNDRIIFCGPFATIFIIFCVCSNWFSSWFTS